jgi:hypothetical protein
LTGIAARILLPYSFLTPLTVAVLLVLSLDVWVKTRVQFGFNARLLVNLILVADLHQKSRLLVIDNATQDIDFDQHVFELFYPLADLFPLRSRHGLVDGEVEDEGKALHLLHTATILNPAVDALPHYFISSLFQFQIRKDL